MFFKNTIIPLFIRSLESTVEVSFLKWKFLHLFWLLEHQEKLISWDDLKVQRKFLTIKIGKIYNIYQVDYYDDFELKYSSS